MNEEKVARRHELYRLLGDLPELDGDVEAKLLNIETRANYVVEKLELTLNGIEPVPAYFVYPRERKEKTPVILFNHSHGGIYDVGKDEVFYGKGYLQLPCYAEFLTSLGFSVLSIDAWGFGERFTRSESSIFKEMLLKGQVMWGMMVYDSMRALDYLETRDDVDLSRVGTLGISMGGLMSWWLAALDERIDYCVDMCSLADYEALINAGSLDRHGIYFYVPKLMNHFTVGQINSLIAPRPHLGLAGKLDELVPLDGLERIDQETARVYEAEGAADGWRLIIYDSGHEETPEMRSDIRDFLRHVR